MLNFLCFFLGYLTCYLEFTGKTQAGVAAAGTATLLLFVRTIVGETTKTPVRSFLGRVRESDTRIGRSLAYVYTTAVHISAYVRHHLFGHDKTIKARICTACAIK